MQIEKKMSGNAAEIQIIGRLDTVTAPQLEAVIDKELEDVSALTLDCSALEYVSSAGLRVILKAQKMMNAKGSMKLTGVGDMIMEIFDITGFTDILTIE